MTESLLIFSILYIFFNKLVQLIASYIFYIRAEIYLLKSRKKNFIMKKKIYMNLLDFIHITIYPYRFFDYLWERERGGGGKKE